MAATLKTSDRVQGRDGRYGTLAGVLDGTAQVIFDEPRPGLRTAFELAKVTDLTPVPPADLAVLARFTVRRSGENAVLRCKRCDGRWAYRAVTGLDEIARTAVQHVCMPPAGPRS